MPAIILVIVSLLVGIVTHLPASHPASHAAVIEQKVVASPTASPTPTEIPTATPTAVFTPTPTFIPTATPTIYIYPTAVPTNSGLSNDNYYINSSGNDVHSPAYSNTVPAGATALCRDGTYSFSQHRSGTCSHHGGVAQWL